VVIFSDSLFPDMISAAAEKLKGVPYTTEGIHTALTKASHETSLQEKGADPAKFLLEMRDWLVSAM
jgi:hypothetical protein